MSKFKIVKYEVEQRYGGPEEGGWWYEAGVPVDFKSPIFQIKKNAYAFCRSMNDSERARARREENYEYTSVLSYQSHHYAYYVRPADEEPQPYPRERPHYE